MFTGLFNARILTKHKNEQQCYFIFKILKLKYPSQADTEKMLSYIYQNNQNKTSNDMEIYYIKTSLNKYPNLYTQQFQKNEYQAINQKINFKITQ